MFPEYNVFGLCVSIELRRKFAKVTQDMTDCHIVKELSNLEGCINASACEFLSASF